MSEQQQAVKREHVASTSGDVLETQVARLREVFPEVFVEGKIDWDKLRITLGAAAESGPGRFHFSWAGKDDAVSLLQTPSAGTLIPCPEESVNFDTTGNVFIEGDNLEVLKLLFKPYFGRVKLIYIDPPYNTGQDFVYPDNYADPLKTYLQITGQVDSEGNLLTSNPETSGRYHSTWLSMMYPRLFLARQLLKDDGFICVSIDDHEAHHLRVLMNEVFGEENFIATAVWQKAYTSNMTAKHISDTHDYVVVYAKDAEQAKVDRLARTPEQLAKFANADDDPRGPWKAENLSAGKFYSAGQFEIVTPSGRKVLPPEGRFWRCNEEQYQAWVADKRIWFGKDGNGRPMLKRYLSEVGDGLTPNTWWTHQECGSNKEASISLKELFDGKSVFDTPKPTKLLRRIISLFSEKDSLILDFFGGSGTTAHSVLEANHLDGGCRKFMMVQLPEKISSPGYATIAAVSRARIVRVVKKFEEKKAGSLDFGGSGETQDLGFKVFKLAKPNIQHWAQDEDRDSEAYGQKLALFNDPLVAGWKPENVIWEAALREGFGLNTRFASRDLANGNRVYDVTDPDTEQKFMICLDDKILADLSKHCELKPEDLFMCRDVALDDSAAANLALQCRLKTI